MKDQLLITPLAMIMRELVPELQSYLSGKLNSPVDLVVITKLGNEVQMRDTFDTGGDGLGMSIMVLEGILDNLKGKKLAN